VRKTPANAETCHANAGRKILCFLSDYASCVCMAHSLRPSACAFQQSPSWRPLGAAARAATQYWRVWTPRLPAESCLRACPWQATAARCASWPPPPAARPPPHRFARGHPQTGHALHVGRCPPYHAGALPCRLDAATCSRTSARPMRFVGAHALRLGGGGAAPTARPAAWGPPIPPRRCCATAAIRLRLPRPYGSPAGAGRASGGCGKTVALQPSPCPKAPAFTWRFGTQFRRTSVFAGKVINPLELMMRNPKATSHKRGLDGLFATCDSTVEKAPSNTVLQWIKTHHPATSPDIGSPAWKAWCTGEEVWEPVLVLLRKSG
jgi:hypothetical protein